MTLITNDLRDLEALGGPHRMASTRDYVARPALFEGAQTIINLSRDYGYQTAGYYASLLAEARGHRVIPAVETILDLANRDGYARALPELEEALNRDIAKSTEPAPSSALLCFGKPDDARLVSFARLCFDWFRAPAVLATFAAGDNGRLRIVRLSLRAMRKLTGAQQTFMGEALAAYSRRAWRSPKPRIPPRYSIAVLHDPKEQLPPSSVATLRHWARFAEKQGVEVEPIQKRDLGRLAEFDALFIRETTSIRNHTYRFARRAAAEGMPVIDDPISMIRCTNKVYLWERLTLAGLPTPETIVMRPSSSLEEIADRLGFPVVVKIPDGSFSRGVKKAANLDELRSLTKAFFEETDLLLAQKYVPTTYDWRIGVLGGEPLFACQYLMAKNHWQIVNHRADGSADEGRFTTYALADAPADIVDIGVRAARLIGDGFYGVDLKETTDGVRVIEINDNPNLEHGVEDQKAGAEVWARLTRWFTERIG